MFESPSNDMKNDMSDAICTTIIIIIMNIISRGMSYPLHRYSFDDRCSQKIRKEIKHSF